MIPGLSQWYDRIEAWIAPSWPLLVLLSLVLIVITAVLVLRGQPLPLAAWLAYMYSP